MPSDRHMLTQWWLESLTSVSADGYVVGSGIIPEVFTAKVTHEGKTEEFSLLPIALQSGDIITFLFVGEEYTFRFIPKNGKPEFENVDAAPSSDAPLPEAPQPLPPGAGTDVQQPLVEEAPVPAARTAQNTAEDTKKEPVEAAAQPIAEDIASAMKEAARKLEENACGGGAGAGASLPLLAFGAGGGHENSQDSHKENGDDGKYIDDGKRHSSFTFRAKYNEVVQRNAVIPTPNGTITQYGLSTSATNGERTNMPRNTWPALSQILDSRSNWDPDKIGSTIQYL